LATPFVIPTVPCATPSTTNVTEPVGSPEPGDNAIIVAVNVNGCSPSAVERVNFAVVPLFDTTCDNGDNVLSLPVKFPSPPYTAVNECVPTDNVLVIKAATPLALIVPVPINVPPSKNDTVPVATPPPVLDVNLALSVTPSPNFDGFADDVNDSVLDDFVTACVTGLDADPGAKSVFPSYVAVIECVPTDNTFVVNVAVADAPDPDNVAVPNTVLVVVSVNVT